MSNLFVVAKPFDIDQVLKDKSFLESNKDNIWLVVDLKNQNKEMSLKSLQANNQENIIVLPSPILSDLFLNTDPASSYFIKIEHLQAQEKWSVSSLLMSLSFNLIKIIYKINYYFLGYLYWFYCFLRYKNTLKGYKIESIYIQSYAQKLLPLICLGYKEIVFYAGGRSSIDSGDEEIFFNYGTSGLIKMALDHKRNTAMPQWILKKFYLISKVKSRYISILDSNPTSDDNIKISLSGLVDDSYILVVGSYEKIDLEFKKKLDSLMGSKNLFSKETKKKSLLYRPHPRRILSKKETTLLKDFNFTITQPISSLEQDIKSVGIKDNIIPGTIITQNSSAELVLENFLPSQVLLIKDVI